MKTKNKYCKDWVKRFAFFPTRVNDKTIWLESYYERYVEKYKLCDCGCSCNIVGWWETKLFDDDKTLINNIKFSAALTHTTDIANPKDYQMAITEDYETVVFFRGKWIGVKLTW